MSRAKKVQHLLEFCLLANNLPDLMAALNRERPTQYKELFAPMTDSITSPDPPKAHYPLQVFISHAHQDREIAQKLTADLRSHGWKVWIVPESIQPGEKFAEAISRGLKESEIFVVLLSQNAVSSQWVRLESDAAIDRSTKGKLQFIPLEFERVELPVLWNAYQRIDFVADYDVGLSALLTRLAGIDKVTEDLESDNDSTNEDDPKPPVDPKELVHIEAGSFLYGENKRELSLPEFWIARTLVTNAEYADFVKSSNHQPPAHWANLTSSALKEIADHPVVYVTWHDATAYANWAGKELPTEQEWEKAARGTDGRDYPWGNEIPTPGRCNIGFYIGSTTPVGEYSPQGDSPYGCVDMAGNVWEWTNSWYDESHTSRVLRGGAFRYLEKHAKSTYRDQGDPTKCDSNTGFRIVESVTSPGSERVTKPKRGN
jgi:formylglycine-generating enzyme required for sulfatase activity